MTHRCRWKAREDDYLRKHWRTGIEARTAMARALNRTPGAVQTRGSRLGLPTVLRPWEAAERSVVIAYYGCGKSPREIATLLPGRSRMAVIGEARRLRSRGLLLASRCFTPSLPRLTFMENPTWQ